MRATNIGPMGLPMPTRSLIVVPKDLWPYTVHRTARGGIISPEPQQLGSSEHP
jgi:hypothetical protein